MTKQNLSGVLLLYFWISINLEINLRDYKTDQVPNKFLILCMNLHLIKYTKYLLDVIDCRCQHFSRNNTFSHFNNNLLFLQENKPII